MHKEEHGLVNQGARLEIKLEIPNALKRFFMAIILAGSIGIFVYFATLLIEIPFLTFIFNVSPFLVLALYLYSSWNKVPWTKEVGLLFKISILVLFIMSVVFPFLYWNEINEISAAPPSVVPGWGATGLEGVAILGLIMGMASCIPLFLVALFILLEGVRHRGIIITVIGLLILSIVLFIL